MAKGTADDPSSTSPAPPRVLLACALGRLGADASDSAQHALLADDLSDAAQAVDVKKARAHLKAIMRKGGDRLAPGKRLRLRNDDDGYDVHIVAERLDDVSPPCTLVLFALTVQQFSKYYSAAEVLRQLRVAVLDSADRTFLATTKASNTSANRAALQPAFARIAAQFGQSPLATAESKVSAVKDLMTASVAKALNSVEHLEELEESSERFQEQSKQFHKKTSQVKKVHRKNYYFMGGLLGLLIVAVLLYAPPHTASPARCLHCLLPLASLHLSHTRVSVYRYFIIPGS